MLLVQVFEFSLILCFCNVSSCKYESAIYVESERMHMVQCNAIMGDCLRKSKTMFMSRNELFNVYVYLMKDDNKSTMITIYLCYLCIN